MPRKTTEERIKEAQEKVLEQTANTYRQVALSLSSHILWKMYETNKSIIARGGVLGREFGEVVGMARALEIIYFDEYRVKLETSEVDGKKTLFGFSVLKLEDSGDYTTVERFTLDDIKEVIEDFEKEKKEL